MVSAFDLVAILVMLTAAFGWLNHVVFRLPHTIGLLVMGLLASLVLILIKLAIPQISLHENLTCGALVFELLGLSFVELCAFEQDGLTLPK